MSYHGRRAAPTSPRADTIYPEDSASNIGTDRGSRARRGSISGQNPPNGPTLRRSNTSRIQPNQATLFTVCATPHSTASHSEYERAARRSQRGPPPTSYREPREDDRTSRFSRPSEHSRSSSTHSDAASAQPSQSRSTSTTRIYLGQRNFFSAIRSQSRSRGVTETHQRVCHSNGVQYIERIPAQTSTEPERSTMSHNDSTASRASRNGASGTMYNPIRPTAIEGPNGTVVSMPRTQHSSNRHSSATHTYQSERRSRAESHGPSDSRSRHSRR